MTLINISIKGGPGSGNWGHRGIPGKVGGSSPRSRGGTPSYGNLSTVDARANSVLMSAIGDSYNPNAFANAIKHENTQLNEYKANNNAVGVESARRAIQTYQAMVDNNAFWRTVGIKRRHEIKANIVTNLSTDTGIAQENVNEIMGEWAETSNDSSAEALSMQEAVSDEFGVSLSAWQRGKIDIVNSSEVGGPVKGYVSRPNERKVLRAMYNNTQAELKTAGYKSGDTVTLYRGYIGGGRGTTIPDRDTDVDYHGNAMESWSILPSIASSFGRHPKRGRVLSMNVPVENVLSTATTGFGCLTEGEFVVLGGIPSQVAHIMSLDDLGL